MMKPNDKIKIVTPEKFNKKFDAGDEESKFFSSSLSKKMRSSAVQRVNIDVPVPMVIALDKEADRIGVTRTALIKMWMAQHLDHLAE